MTSTVQPTLFEDTPIVAAMTPDVDPVKRIRELRKELHTECYVYTDGYSRCVAPSRALEIQSEIMKLHGVEIDG